MQAKQLPLFGPEDWPTETDEAIYEHRVRVFRQLCRENQAVFEEKNKQYGDAIRLTGVLGAAIELIGCVNRLQQLVVKAPGHGRGNEEAIFNVLTDAHNYANIAAMMLEDQNWEGESEEDE